MRVSARVKAMQARAKRATHCHVKSRGLYRVLHRGWLEHTLEPVVIYESVFDGSVWVRPAVEFDDGRFAVLTKD